MLNLSKPIETRDGKSARLLCADLVGGESLAVAVMGGDGDEYVQTNFADGAYLSGRVTEMDLVNVPEKHTVYLNVYPIGMPTVYPTREIADASKGTTRVACVEVSYEMPA